LAVSSPLALASHNEETLYWEGGHYELNMSFEALRDKQWLRVMQAIWGHPNMFGPLEHRFIPGGRTIETAIAIPPPTATQAQHGQILVSTSAAGCDVLATRSLFECVSVLVPLGMFDGLQHNTNDPRKDNPSLGLLDDVFAAIALAVYDVVPFKLAALGWERECQVVAELRSDDAARDALVRTGNFFAQDEVLRQLNIPMDSYPPVRNGLRWAAPQS
jgi:hypothetical protein